MNHKRVLALLSSYAIAMALLEAAVVVYMRRLYYPENPLELFPLSFLDSYDPVLELSREAATVVMILTVALLAGQRTFTKRFAAFVFVFGMWDLFYYAWLKVLIDWPRSWLEWDVLFLIPSVWLGPWICPAAIALLFVVWGFLALAPTREAMSSREAVFTPHTAMLFAIGAGCGLVSFMQPAIANGYETLRDYRPGGFWWWLFAIGYLLMTAGLVLTLKRTKVV
ncbi:MAG: hypothetical protein AAGG48_29860 [Planctomycetota bacterium]